MTPGGYCTLPQNVSATLTYNSGTGTYTYTPSPGTSYTYCQTGALTSETDAAGNTLTITSSTPAPGSGHCPSTATSCETITSASGRDPGHRLQLQRPGHLRHRPPGRRWTYAYTAPA